MKRRSLNARSETQPGHTLEEVERGAGQVRACSLLARCPRTRDLVVDEIGGGARSMRAGERQPEHTLGERERGRKRIETAWPRWHSCSVSPRDESAVAQCVQGKAAPWGGEEGDDVYDDHQTFSS